VTAVDLLRDKLELSVFTDELFGENCYLLCRRDTKAALVIDPGLQYSQVLRRIADDGRAVEAILITHAHVDHLAGVPAVRAETAAPVSMHPDDHALLDWGQFQGLPFIPAGFQPFTVDNPLAQGQAIDFQDLRLRVLHTPGHTQGSVCFLIGIDCFAGDTLFQRSIGRTDLPGGDAQMIALSIRNVLYALPAKTVVHPGHGPRTSIEEEMMLNPFVPGLKRM
jgi:glyoxylase-like metal-dependent hydrolase (beta-lactamase superfamily II)